MAGLTLARDTMANNQRTTVVVKRAGRNHKICKIWFGSDGSYYVTVPYHSANKAVITCATLNYAAGPIQEVAVSDMLEVASLDDEGRLKLSHHPDGFCQFSGHGILSGLDENGRPRGVGVFARALTHVANGPTFGLVFYGLQEFATCEVVGGDDVAFDADSLIPLPGCDGFRIEGYYLRPEFRRFVETDNWGVRWISLIHPTTAVLRLRVVVAPKTCEFPGLIGLHMFPSPCSDGESGFSITGPGGNLRDNARGENVGDMITAIYPRPDQIPTRRDLTYSPRKD
jgi:hypothetical protein